MTGKKDLMASPGDYNWLKKQLSNNEDTEMWEYDLGHTSLVTPVDKTHINRIFKAVKELDGDLGATEGDGDKSPSQVLDVDGYDKNQGGDGAADNADDDYKTVAVDNGG